MNVFGYMIEMIVVLEITRVQARRSEKLNGWVSARWGRWSADPKEPLADQRVERTNGLVRYSPVRSGLWYL